MNFNQLVHQIVTNQVRAEVIARAVPVLNRQHQVILEAFRPSYWTPAGLTMCNLHKVDISPRNGATVAYYDCRYWHPALGRRISVRYLYGVRNGTPYQIAELSRR